MEASTITYWVESWWIERRFGGIQQWMPHFWVRRWRKRLEYLYKKWLAGSRYHCVIMRTGSFFLFLFAFSVPPPFFIKYPASVDCIECRRESFEDVTYFRRHQQLNLRIAHSCIFSIQQS